LISALEKIGADTRDWADKMTADFSATLARAFDRFDAQMDKEREGHAAEVTGLRAAQEHGFAELRGAIDRRNGNGEQTGVQYRERKNPQ
jgi:hypothetical protein